MGANCRRLTACGDSCSPLAKHIHTKNRTTTTCYLSIVVLLITAVCLSAGQTVTPPAPTNQTGFTTSKSTTSTNSSSEATTTVQTPGDHASVNEIGAERQPKSLEYLLLTRTAPPADKVFSANSNNSEIVNRKASQNETNSETTNQRASITTVITGPPATVAGTTTTPAAPTKPLAASNGTQNYQPPAGQTKTFKFTLIAGKSWKFNIKPNSLSSHNRAELRLHKNVSHDNYIIDDEGWFQYNPQQQQLFAWPSLNTKSGTYYYVLVPSGIDYEANSENSVHLDVAASIVVELIKPIYKDVQTGDIGQLVDHEFSLAYLQRHPGYPLLLNQIFSAFEALAKTTTNSTTTHTTTTTATPTTSPPSSLLTTISPNHQVAGRPATKLAEYLLLGYTYSSDGEVFSITWSSHPSLLNNTLRPLSECRVGTITDTISKLSSLSTAYQSDDERFTIHYSLEAPQSGTNSQALAPTERTNSLKLTLNGPCREPKIIEELGIQQPQQQPQHQVNKVAAATGAALSAIDDNENNIADKLTPSNSTTIKTLSPTNIANSSAIPGSEALVTSTANQITPDQTLSVVSSPPPQITTAPVDPETSIVPNQSRSISPESTTPDSATEEVSSPKTKILQVSEPPFVKTSNTPLQQPKVHHQAKSLEDYLEMSDSQSSSTLNPLDGGSTGSPPSSNLSSASVNNVTSATPIGDGGISVVPSKTVTPKPAESTLNEDFMGILDDVMNYLISVAVPASIIVGTILLISIIFALCHLYRKRRKTKEFQVRNRFDFRYSSERKGFLKNSSRPVILEADQKSLSMGGTPQHKATSKNKQKITDEDRKHYLPMSTLGFNPGPSS